MGLALESNGFKDSEQAQTRKLDEFLWFTTEQLDCGLTSQNKERKEKSSKIY